MNAPTFQRRLVAGGMFGCLVSVAVILWWLCAWDNDIAFLPDKPGASWIVPPIPAGPDLHRDVALVAKFRCDLHLSEKPETASLAARVFRSGKVRINGAECTAPVLDGRGWKQIQQTNVAALLRSGANEIEVTVTNRLGPPGLWLRLELPQGELGTDASWEVAQTDGNWQPARLAATPMPIEPGSRLDGQATLPNVLSQAWPPLLGLALLSALGVALGLRCSRMVHRPEASFSPKSEARLSDSARTVVSRPTRRRPAISAIPALFLVWLVWGALFVNNLPQLPRLFGFDAEGHEEYIRYVQQNRALPLANEGWQMYQPPLYYLAAAAVLEAGVLTTEDETSVVLLRALNGLVGLMHCALVFLCLRWLFPEQRWKQVAGTLFAGILPAHLCLSHYVTNETPAAAFVTAAIYFCLRVLCPRHSPEDERNRKAEFWNSLWAGVALGCALLTKFSAVLALPVLAGVLVWPTRGARSSELHLGLRRAGTFLVAVVALCGWHYGRVCIHFGTPLVGNWDAASGFAWWQLPGYHTTEYYTRFGEAFLRPLFSSFASFADGVYATLWGDGLASSAAWMAFRPPWNYEFMLAAGVLAGIATCLIGVGFAAGTARALRQADVVWVLFAGLLAVFALGILYMSLRVPSYAQVKAFYGLPALLPLAVALLAGWEWLVGKLRWLHSVLWVWFVTWALTIWFAFWIRPDNPETHVVKAIWALDRGRTQEAATHYQRAVSLDASHRAVVSGLTEAVRVKPGEALFHGLFASVLQQQDRIPEALHEYREALRLQAENPTLLNNLAWLLATHPEARFRDGPEAVRLAEQACSLTGRTESVFLGTLAAAYAEAGRFAEAVATATVARELALRAGNAELAKKNSQLAEVYRTGKAWREVPRSSKVVTGG